MGFFRDYLLLQALLGSNKTAIAARDEAGTPVCGGCRTEVAENATTCPSCTADLYTKRGRFGRRVFGFFGFAFLLMALLPPGEGPGLGTLGSIVVVPVALLLLYLSIQWYRNKPVRELNVRGTLPF